MYDVKCMGFVCVCLHNFKNIYILWSVYSTKIEKEKREHAKQHGMIRTEITGAEIAEEMEKERRLFQLQMCEVGARATRTANNYTEYRLRIKQHVSDNYASVVQG